MNGYYNVCLVKKKVTDVNLDKKIRICHIYRFLWINK